MIESGRGTWSVTTLDAVGETTDWRCAWMNAVGWRVWINDGEETRLLTVRPFDDRSRAEAYAADVVGALVLQADVVPPHADAASRQTLRQQGIT